MDKQSYLANVHKKERVVYLSNRKVALSTLDQILMKNGFKGRRKVEIDFDDLDFIFTFVRNPWDRLISRYSHLQRRIRKITNKGIALKHSPQDRNLKDFFGDEPIRIESFTFEKFVDFTSEVNDAHWMPQTSMFADCLDKIHFVGRFETLQQDFNFVCDRIGIARQELPIVNKTKHKHYTEYYCDKTQKIVAERYKNDIEVFKYEFGK